jgi:hypothetical protein
MNASLVEVVSMALECGELMNANQRARINAGLGRLKSGKHFTPEQRGYWGAYVKRVRKSK